MDEFTISISDYGFLQSVLFFSLYTLTLIALADLFAALEPQLSKPQGRPMTNLVPVAGTVSYGMGGDAVDRAASDGGGEDYLVSRLKAKGIDTLGSVYEWSDTQARFDALRKLPVSTKKFIVGDSLGDNVIGEDVHALQQEGVVVDFIGGFQGSEWGEHTTISDNVRYAVIVYNPNVFETAGLGAYPLPLDVPPVVPEGRDLYDGHWYLGNNGKTWIRYVQIAAPHPDDWGLAQNIVYDDIIKLRLGLLPTQPLPTS
jgi:hypothetical protein